MQKNIQHKIQLQHMYKYKILYVTNFIAVCPFSHFNSLSVDSLDSVACNNVYNPAGVSVCRSITIAWLV